MQKARSRALSSLPEQSSDINGATPVKVLKSGIVVSAVTPRGDSERHQGTRAAPRQNAQRSYSEDFSPNQRDYQRQSAPSPQAKHLSPPGLRQRLNDIPAGRDSLQTGNARGIKNSHRRESLSERYPQRLQPSGGRSMAHHTAAEVQRSRADFRRTASDEPWAAHDQNARQSTDQPPLQHPESSKYGLANGRRSQRSVHHQARNSQVRTSKGLSSLGREAQDPPKAVPDSTALASQLERLKLEKERAEQDKLNMEQQNIQMQLQTQALLEANARMKAKNAELEMSYMQAAARADLVESMYHTPDTLDDLEPGISSPRVGVLEDEYDANGNDLDVHNDVHHVKVGAEEQDRRLMTGLMFSLPGTPSKDSKERSPRFRKHSTAQSPLNLAQTDLSVRTSRKELAMGSNRSPRAEESAYSSSWADESSTPK